MLRSALTLPAALLLSWTIFESTSAAEFQLEQTERGVTVKLNGELFTEYRYDQGAKPILWPIIGPTGAAMTRAYPMERLREERKDHHHHRSFWFTHGDVNGVDFWSETGRNGVIKHREFTEVEGGEVGTIVSVNDWLDREGNKLCEDRRTIRFRTLDDTRVIDFDITIKASDGEVRFGDTKEGTFGIRIPTSMDVDSRKGGSIVNSEGQKDRDTWGQPARWVDYYGPVGDEVLGVAILNHPSSFRYPTHWHVRTYGLFAANPFGLGDFPGPDDADGTHVLQSGESITLRYRVLFHRGDTEAGRVVEAFEAYAQEP